MHTSRIDQAGTHDTYELRMKSEKIGARTALHEFALSLNEVSQVRNSYNVLRLLVHVDEPQLTILPFGGPIDAHQDPETVSESVGFESLGRLRGLWTRSWRY